MSDKQMYAEPISHLALDEADLTRLRRELQVAEGEVQRAKTWTAKTRAEQDVISLQRQITGAELQRRTEAAHQRLNRPRADEHAAMLRKAVSEGRCLPPRPYFARDAAEDSLPELKRQAHKFQSVIDNPAASAAEKAHAQAELDRIKQLIRSLEEMQPTGSVGVGHSASDEALTFDQVTQVVERARKAGVVQSYNITKPKA